MTRFHWQPSTINFPLLARYQLLSRHYSVFLLSQHSDSKRPTLYISSEVPLLYILPLLPTANPPILL